MIKIFNALASDKRLQVLDWLKDPTKHFPPQVFGDLEKDGVCSVKIAEKLGISQPTVSRHLNLLVDAGLLRPNRIKQWTFYLRDEKQINAAKKLIKEKL
jgi:ArsR family transcriptional regulator